MNKVKVQVTMTFTANVFDDLSVDSIMERVDLTTIGDGEIVEVCDAEIEDYRLIEKK